MPTYTPATINPYRATSNNQVVTYNPQNQFIQSYPGTNPLSGNINQPISGDLNVVQNTPTTATIQPFSTLDNLNMQSQAWADTNPNLSSAYQTLASGLGAYGDTANQIGSFYDEAARQIAAREGNYANAQYQLANQLNQDLANQRDYIWGVFGPQGSLTQEINKYYDDMGNYLASEGGRQMANVAAQGVHSGASLGLLRAQQNEAYNQAFENYMKVKEQELNAKQQIQAQLINYMQALRQEYGNTTNQYILSQYQRANDLLNSLTTDLNNQYTSLAVTKLNNSLSRGSGTSTSNAGASLQDLLMLNLLKNQGVQNIDNPISNNADTNSIETQGGVSG